jgi:hypothetical protein
MALTSPRFKFSHTLNRVAANSATLSVGSVGRAVHLVQMALVDLGYALPISTGNVHYSPDGIYGDETKRAVKQFQKDSRTLVDDGVVGQKTMEELDRRLNACKHRVRLHFRSIALTDVPFHRSLANTENVFAQYGIKIEFASGQSIGLSPDQQQLFLQIDQDCTWELDDGEFSELHELGTPAPPNDVLVFHVSKFSENTLLGCGGHAKNRPACTVAAHAGAWDTAHEVCHVLLGKAFAPVHIVDQRNLMYQYSIARSAIPVLTSRQVAQIRTSACCTAI